MYSFLIFSTVRVNLCAPCALIGAELPFRLCRAGNQSEARTVPPRKSTGRLAGGKFRKANAAKFQPLAVEFLINNVQYKKAAALLCCGLICFIRFPRPFIRAGSAGRSFPSAQADRVAQEKNLRSKPFGRWAVC